MDQIDVTEVGAVAQAIVAWGEAIVASLDPVDALMSRLGVTKVLTAARRESLAIALAAGVTDATLRTLIDAVRVARKATIVLPPGRHEHLSRGRGWARKGKGACAEWGEREDGGYRVGPGRWEVGSTDGFSRKDNETWSVKHVNVGGNTWTVAS